MNKINEKFNFEDIDWRLNEQQLILDGRNYYILKIVDLPDFSGEPQGAVFVSFDITELEFPLVLTLEIKKP